MLSGVYENGQAGEPFQPNRRRALQVLVACSRAVSNPELLCEIGRMYASGWGDESGRKDYDMAFRFTESAARMKYVDALADLGVMYADGKGTISSFKKAAEAYEAAATTFPRPLRGHDT